MTDRELLELAAKAAGVAVPMERDLLTGRSVEEVRNGLFKWTWNPLADDGAALWLAVKLGLAVEVDLCDDATRVSETGCELLAKHMHFDGGPEAATRRAIVRAAAELGKGTAAPGAQAKEELSEG